MKKPILILYNKISENPSEDELDVLDQVKIVTDALVEMNYQVKELQLDMNLDKAIKEIGKIDPYVVFNLVESINNKGEFAYFAPSLLASLNIPFTGNPLVPMFISSNKVMAKKELSRLKIPTPGWLMTDEMNKIRKNKKYILKPIWEEGSLGLDEDSIFEGSNREYVEKVAQKDKQYYFVEEFIEGREFNVSILGTKDGPKVLPMAEMTFLKFPEGKPKIMGYTAKWKEDSFEYTHTRRTFKIPKSDKDIQDKIREICEKCWNEIGFKGYVRIDFRVTRESVPLVIDINLNPCLSESGGFMAASKKRGLDFPHVVSRIIADALRK